MEQFTIVTWCDGTCGLSPQEHERQHPDPYKVLRDQIAEQIGNKAANSALAIIDAHPVLEVRPYHPSKDAYDAACEALAKRVAIVTAVKALHSKPRTERYAAGCAQCGIVWPCPTAKAVGLTDPRPDRQGPIPPEPKEPETWATPPSPG